MGAFKEMTKFVASLYKALRRKMILSMFEINPVLKTSDDKIMAVDATSIHSTIMPYLLEESSMRKCAILREEKPCLKEKEEAWV